MPRTAYSDKGVKHSKEQDKAEHMGDSMKESEKKAKDGGEAGGNTTPGEEAKGNSKDEKSRSEEEAIKQRRLRNKVNPAPPKKQKT